MRNLLRQALRTEYLGMCSLLSATSGLTIRRAQQRPHTARQPVVCVEEGTDCNQQAGLERNAYAEDSPGMLLDAVEHAQKPGQQHLHPEHVQDVVELIGCAPLQKIPNQRPQAEQRHIR